MVHICKTAEEFNEAVAKPTLTLVDFFATWCGPCRMIAPHLEQLEKDNPDVSFVKVDVDELEDVARDNKIEAMPTFGAFKGGRMVDQLVGADAAKLTQFVQKNK